MSVARWVASLVSSALILSLGIASTVRADDAAAAARAYSQGQAAELAGQPGQSAELYETAYRFAPHPVSLRAAIRTHLNAGHRAAAATLCERLLARHADDEKSVEYAQQVLEQVRPEVARLIVRCEVDCVVLVDNQATTLDSGIEHLVYVLPGSRSLSVRFVQAGVESEVQPLEAIAHAEVSAQFAAPILPPQPTRSELGSVRTASVPMPVPVAAESTGIAPIYTIAVAGAALLLGGVATWSAFDVAKAHDSYDRKDRGAEARYEEGKKLEQRTNALIGVAAGVAVTAGVLAIFTRWHGDDKEPKRAAVGAGPGLVGLSLSSSF